MARTTISIDVKEKYRLDYYKGVFGLSSIAETQKMVMDRAHYASYDDIKNLRKMQHQDVKTE